MSTRSIGVIVAVAALVGSVVPVLTQGPGGGRGGGQTMSLPDGPGKDLAQTQCTKCHALNLLANSGGYTRQGWEELFSTMVSLPNDQSAVLADYLAKNFPETPRPKAVMPGQSIAAAAAICGAPDSNSCQVATMPLSRHPRRRAARLPLTHLNRRPEYLIREPPICISGV